MKPKKKMTAAQKKAEALKKLKALKKKKKWHTTTTKIKNGIQQRSLTED
jgi:hypothetical protein